MNIISDNADLTRYDLIINIDLDVFDQYMYIFRKEVGRADRYIAAIKKHKNIYNDYLRLCNVVIEGDQKKCEMNRSLYQKGGGGEYRTIIGRDGLPIQVGGGVSLLSIFGITAITGLIGVLIYMYYRKKKKPKQCLIMYPLYDRTQIPNIAEIVSNIVPKAWFEKAQKEGKSSSQFISETLAQLAEVMQTLKKFDMTAGTEIEKIGKNVTKIALSFGATVASGGTVGSNIVNFPFMIERAATMATALIEKIVNIFNKVEPILKKGMDVLEKVNGKLQDADDILTRSLSATDAKNFVAAEMQIQFLYDIFYVDFKRGPFHCRCWLDYIMKIYIGSNKDQELLMRLICMINDLYSSVNKAVIGFIGSAIDALVPNTMGLGGTLTPLMEKNSYKMYRQILKKLTGIYYSKFPAKMRLLVENPEMMREYFITTLEKNTFGLSGKLITPETERLFVGPGIDMVAQSVHKGMSTMFMFLNIFVIFGEINKGVYNKDMANTLSKERLLLECEKFDTENAKLIAKGKSTLKQIKTTTKNTTKKINKNTDG